MIVKLAVDVYCDAGTTQPVYRVYVNEDMYTERTWIWPSYEIFIREHLVADLPPGRHQVRIEKISGDGNFRVERFTINNTPLIVTDLSFQV
jgi:hypothetical protein